MRAGFYAVELQPYEAFKNCVKLVFAVGKANDGCRKKQHANYRVLLTPGPRIRPLHLHTRKYGQPCVFVSQFSKSIERNLKFITYILQCLP